MPMTYKYLATRFILAALFVTACGGDPGETTSGAATDTGATATTGAPPGSVTTGVTTGESVGESSSGNSSNSGTQGQTDTGATSTGEPLTTSTGEPLTSSTGEPDTSTGEPDTSTGADLCADFEPPGCMENGCPEGQACKVLEDECVSSDCTCDAGTGEINCSPDCGGGSCVEECGPVVCNLFCEDGFKLDANGCEICECNEPQGCGCAKDDECVKTSLGCCPCNAGGMEAPAHKNCVDQVMKCDLPPDQVNCPQVFLCTDAQPACVNGQCVLQ